MSLDELRTELRALRGDFTKPISKMKKADVASQIALLKGIHKPSVISHEAVEEPKAKADKPVKAVKADKPVKAVKTASVKTDDAPKEVILEDSPNISRKKKIKKVEA